ncbi:MAG: DUF1552 domain-containing protein [Myxococcales bacterium]|nr:DUF1552 domain-containing protein [Myxococcales bacterium]
MSRALSRRTFLRGTGACIGLPLLDAMIPALTRAQPVPTRRLLTYYVPNGIHMPSWTPATAGSGFALPPILQPLSAVQNQLLVLTGLANQPAEPDGPGDHAAGTGSFLTCTHVVKTSGTDIRNGISMDQVAAQAIGASTALPSLQLGTDGGGGTGDCDSGYSCAYTRNISWAGPVTPLAKEVSPQGAFDRLFRGAGLELTPEERERRKRLRLSVLDTVIDDANRLQSDLGGADRQKLDEYLTAVRELERRVEDVDPNETCDATAPGDPTDIRDRSRAMSDVMVKAFECDLTRIISFMLGNAGSNQTYPFLGIGDGHHQISHHQNQPSNFAQLETIDTWEIGEFAYLLEQLAAIQEPDGSLLDNSLVFFSSEIEDGNSHRHRNLPVLLAGGGGGTVDSGRHVVYENYPPIANLFIAMLNALDVPATTFGDDGTGPLGGLTL